MMKKIFLCILLLHFLYSCKNNSDLVEVQLPEPEKEIITKFKAPIQYKAKGEPFKLYELPFPFDSLSQPIYGQNLEFHYGKVYLNYANALNNFVSQRNWTDKTISQICSELEPNELFEKNKAGGFYNHSLFFENLTPNTSTKPSEILLNAINTKFGSLESLQSEIRKKGLNTYGSAWLWLVVSPNNQLEIITTINEDNPLMKNQSLKGKPLLCIDLWEHAYINSNASKEEYIKTYLKHINWEKISLHYEKLTNTQSPQ